MDYFYLLPVLMVILGTAGVVFAIYGWVRDSKNTSVVFPAGFHILNVVGIVLGGIIALKGVHVLLDDPKGTTIVVDKRAVVMVAEAAVPEDLRGWKVGERCMIGSDRAFGAPASDARWYGGGSLEVQAFVEGKWRAKFHPAGERTGNQCPTGASVLVELDEMNAIRERARQIGS